MSKLFVTLYYEQALCNPVLWFLIPFLRLLGRFLFATVAPWLCFSFTFYDCLVGSYLQQSLPGCAFLLCYTTSWSVTFCNSRSLAVLFFYVSYFILVPPSVFGPIPFMQTGAFLPSRANLFIASILSDGC